MQIIKFLGDWVHVWVSTTLMYVTVMSFEVMEKLGCCVILHTWTWAPGPLRPSARPGWAAPGSAAEPLPATPGASDLRCNTHTQRHKDTRNRWRSKKSRRGDKGESSPTFLTVSQLMIRLVSMHATHSWGRRRGDEPAWQHGGKPQELREGWPGGTSFFIDFIQQKIPTNFFFYISIYNTLANWSYVVLR